jgi:hypothetical protein
MKFGQVVSSIPARPGRRRLTLEEVLASRRPAVFRDFGDWLFYLGGEVYVLADVDPSEGSEAIPPVLDSRSLIHTPGIETGWRHSDDCDCEVCSRDAA